MVKNREVDGGLFVLLFADSFRYVPAGTQKLLAGRMGRTPYQQQGFRVPGEDSFLSPALNGGNAILQGGMGLMGEGGGVTGFDPSWITFLRTVSFRKLTRV